MARLWILLITLLTALALAPTVGFAQDEDEDEEPDYARVGGYVRGAGQLALTTSKDGFLIAPPVSWQPEFGLDIALGWRNSERLALELEFEWITNHQDIGLGSWLIGANGKFYILEDRIQPYVIVGASGMWTKIPGAISSRDDWAFRNGIGVDYYLDNHWAISAESTFVWGVGDIWKNYFLTMSLGAMYRF